MANQKTATYVVQIVCGENEATKALEKKITMDRGVYNPTGTKEDERMVRMHQADIAYIGTDTLDTVIAKLDAIIDAQFKATP